MIAFDLDDFELVPMAPGLRVGFPLHSATGTASTATVLFELDPGADLGVHTDSAEELLIILQGTAEARVGDEVGRLETRQVGLVPPMAPHGLRNIGDDVLPRARDVLRLDRRLDVRATVRGGRAAGARDRLARPAGGTAGRARSCLAAVPTASWSPPDRAPRGGKCDRSHKERVYFEESGRALWPPRLRIPLLLFPWPERSSGLVRAFDRQPVGREEHR